MALELPGQMKFVQKPSPVWIRSLGREVEIKERTLLSNQATNPNLKKRQMCHENYQTE